MVSYQPGKDFEIVDLSIDPTEDTGGCRGEEARVRQALRASRDRRRLALSDRHAAGHRCADQGGRLRLRPDSRPGRQADPVCACQLDPDRDAGGQARAVLHGSRIFAAGSAAGPGRSLPSQDRLAGRQHSDVLLPLRSDTNKHSLLIARVVQLACLLTVLILGGFMLVMFRRDIRSSRAIRSQQHSAKA